MSLLRKIVLVITFCIAFTSLSACTKVQPWQKGNLAKSHMGFDADPIETKFVQHTYESREGSSGGYGIGGGGCGCN